jgi:hypothetical protein
MSASVVPCAPGAPLGQSISVFGVPTGAIQSCADTTLAVIRNMLLTTIRRAVPLTTPTFL